jgi:tetratricopeptide (TPR) repeat protein
MEIEWDKPRGGYVKKIYDQRQRKSVEISQKNIFFVDSKSGYLSYLAVYYESRKQYEKCIECYKESIEHNPGLCSPYFRIGSIYCSYLQQFKNALRYYLKADKLRPNNATIAVSVAHVYHKLCEHDKAIKYLANKAKYINHPRIWLQLGLAYQEANDLENAERCYRKTISMDPNHKSAKLFLALTFGRNNYQLNNSDLETCKEVISDIENKQKKDLVDYMNLASIFRMLDFVPQSIKCFETVLQLNPKDSEAWTVLGTLYEQQNSLQKSKSCYEKAVESDPNNDKAIKNLISIRNRI